MCRISRRYADNTIPTVASVTPGGTNEAVGGNIVITFSEPMDITKAGTVRLNNLAALTGGTWTSGTAFYSQTLAATGVTPITWSIVSGTPPNGLTLDPAAGIISGTPTTPGTYIFNIRASNSAGSDDYHCASKTLSC